MTVLALVAFVWALLAVAGAIAGSIWLYKYQHTMYQTTLENIRRLDSELLDDVRFEGLQLRRTNAGRELLRLFEQNGEMVLSKDKWSDSGYRKEKRLAARRNEMQFRYRNMIAPRASGYRSRMPYPKKNAPRLSYRRSL